VPPGCPSACNGQLATVHGPGAQAYPSKPSGASASMVGLLPRLPPSLRSMPGPRPGCRSERRRARCSGQRRAGDVAALLRECVAVIGSAAHFGVKAETLHVGIQRLGGRGVSRHALQAGLAGQTCARRRKPLARHATVRRAGPLFTLGTLHREDLRRVRPIWPATTAIRTRPAGSGRCRPLRALTASPLARAPARRW